MRCNNHYSDLSSTVGVCATCLRQRLHSLIAAEQHIESQIQYSDGKHRNYEKNPVLSSQFNSRKSDHHRLHPPAVHAQRHRRSLSDQLFDRTPEVRPTTNSKKKRSFIRLLSFNIFRSRNRKSTDTVTVTVTDPRASDSSVRESRGGNTATSSSWFSAIISASRNRHRRKHTLCTGESATTAGDGPVRRQHCGGRGMSPARNSDVVTGDETESQNATESLKHTPRRTPVVRRGGSGGHVRNISGLSFCLSPLVRASPSPNLHKVLPPDVVLPADVGAPAKPHLSYAKSFCANRSRKLVDYGRLNPNR